MRKGLSEKSIKNLRTTLHTILVYAVKWGYLDRLPELPQVRVPEASLTGISARGGSAVHRGRRERVGEGSPDVSVAHGRENGRAAGDPRSDVDFAPQRIHIRQSAPEWLDEEKAPKSNRHRWVDLTPELAAALRSIRGGGQLVFCKGDGGKLSPGQFREILAAAQRQRDSNLYLDRTVSPICRAVSRS